MAIHGGFSKAGAIYLSDGGIYFDYSSPVSVTPTIIVKMRQGCRPEKDLRSVVKIPQQQVDGWLF